MPGEMSNELTHAIRREFAGDVRRRGEQYLFARAVQINHVDATSIQAVVTGRGEYLVILDWSGRELSAYCDCPYFDHDPCKHLWATAMAYDATGTTPAHLAGKLFVMAGEEDVGIEDYDAVEDDFYQKQDEAEEENAAWGRDEFAARVLPFQPPTAKRPDWKQLLAGLRDPVRRDGGRPGDMPPADSELQYVIDVSATLAGRGLAVNVLLRKRKQNGDWGVARPRAIRRDQIDHLPDPADRRIAAMLLGANTQSYDYYGYRDSQASTFLLGGATADAALPLLCESGRCRLMDKHGESGPILRGDEGPPWEFHLDVGKDADDAHYVLSGTLRRDEEWMELASPALLIDGGWVFWPDHAARLIDHGAFRWIVMLRKAGEIRVPLQQADELLEHLLRAPVAPPITLPKELAYEEVRLSPKPCLRFYKPDRHWRREVLLAELTFDYDGRRMDGSTPGRGVYVKASRRFVLWDRTGERAAADRLETLGLRPDPYDRAGALKLAPKHLPRVVTALVAEGWEVQAEDALYRRAGDFQLRVSSGIDWFELHGEADFDGVSASLPALLAALNEGESFVRLDDGSMGILPEQWLRKFDVLASVAATEDNHLRFKTSQAGFLDALLAAQPDATCDETFERARRELRRFERIEPADAPAGFVGELRPYQRDGLGWLHFLQRFGFGGFLADDMGLGKTVQVLALLESRRRLRADSANGNDRPGPSLAVVPRSLVFNWSQEAARFTPKLRVLAHHGTDRPRDPGEVRADFENHDLVVTTYGTLRRDVVHLKDIAFDYLIFDESQAIKNAKTASAKAARLLAGRHRLCLSGTPIENHLGELWSQFEVLNPGMLGTSPAFVRGINAGGDETGEQSRRLLALALRPFILRRTKDQVAPDLPAKTEQTLYCELKPAQRKLYDELRDHYRRSLLARVDREGIGKSKIQILEALLRLRQAAIHPGLIDKARASKSSAKLEALLAQLEEVLEEGHKALVFSQFTTMLSILRDRLDKSKIIYEYLDGRTRKRQDCVDRFQNDPECRLFLISLKAGGLGLNLTAADYVFLLDPWWNPAVEAQAIDRAHRIGQQRQVFAYRLIASDTVEQRIVELQESKRALAEAIITVDNSLIRKLSRGDLEMLLG